MANKKKRRQPTRAAQSRQEKSRAKGGGKYTILAVAVGVVLIVTGVYFLSQGEDTKRPAPEPAKVVKENVKLRETRPTLSPDRFTGQVRRAYQIAREIPEVLDQLYCYCRCKENFGHKSLLSCYVDTHAST